MDEIFMHQIDFESIVKPYFEDSGWTLNESLSSKLRIQDTLNSSYSALSALKCAQFAKKRIIFPVATFPVITAKMISQSGSAAIVLFKYKI